MLTLKVILVLFLPADLTFKNVTFHSYNIYMDEFTQTIPSSNNLKDFLPKSGFDKIEFIQQHIPVLYENSLSDLNDLNELVIEDCEVFEVQPGAFKNVLRLRRLSLKGNKLEEIKEGVFNNLGILTLDLSLNSITTIDSDAFDHLPNILIINLADNKIGGWDRNWFKDTPQLTRIYMQNNSIASLPDCAFRNLVGAKLNEVNVAINLILSYNKIKVIDPKAFEGLAKIDNLWLDNNQLENFEESLLDKVNVKYLRLNHNNICCLDGDLAKIIKSETTHLDANPLDCECLDKIKTWAEGNEKNVEFFSSEMDCSVQRLKNKITTIERRLKKLKYQDDDIEVAEGLPKANPIK